MIVCLCKSITDRDIAESVDNGVTSFEAMQAHLNVSSVCGSCSCEVKHIIQQKLQKDLSQRAPVSQFKPLELIL